MPLFKALPTGTIVGDTDTQTLTNKTLTTPIFNAVPSFSAHKNGTDQTGIANTTFTKVTFGTEVYDTGGFYDTTLSRWTPPAGNVTISAFVSINTVTAGQAQIISIYKNGTRFKDGQCYGSTVDGVGITINDLANGTDYYEVFIYLTTSTTGVVAGLASNTHFSGRC